MKEMVHTDPYQLSSVISLLDLAVGHGTKLTQTDRVSYSLFTFLVSLFSEWVYYMNEVVKSTSSVSTSEIVFLIE